jgi:hypothetical protein
MASYKISKNNILIKTKSYNNEKQQKRSKSFLKMETFFFKQKKWAIKLLID